MSNNYITIDHLDQTTWSLVQKINSKQDDRITATDIQNWNNKSDFDGNYNSLTNKPDILTETDVNDIADDITFNRMVNNNKTFGVGWLDITNSNRIIYVSNVAIGHQGASYYSTPFLFMIKRYTTDDYGTIINTIPGTSNFKLYNALNPNSQIGSAENISIRFNSTEKFKIGQIYIAQLDDGIIECLPLTTNTEVSSMIASAIGNINSFEVSIVTSLPTENIDTHTIYFMANNSSGNNIYDEYMYINNNWEKIGSTAVDLSNYVEASKIDTSNSSFIINNGFGRVYLQTTTERSNYSKVDLNGSNLNLKSWTGVTNEGNANTITLTPTQTTIKNIITPINNGDAVNKKYVDDAIPLIIHITDPNLTSTYTCDKTYSEISTALQNNRPVIAINDMAQMSVDVRYQGNQIYIPFITVEYDGSMQLDKYILNSNDQITESEYDFTIPTSGSGNVTITNTLQSGTLIATINGTNIYAPAYTDADGVSY